MPRSTLCHLPTALEHLPRLSAHLGGAPVYVKRDDCTGLAIGGNKARKLEFLMGEAVTRGADTVITQGAVQSNHVRQTAAAAAKLGIRCEVLFHHRLESPDFEYLHSGNVLLDDLFGAQVSNFPVDTDMAAELERVAKEVAGRGGVPYIIPVGGSNPVGALGYADCARELLIQFAVAGVAPSHIVLATGSAGTQAGLVAGLRACGSRIPVLGFSVSAEAELQADRVYQLAVETAELLGVGLAVERDDISVDDGFLGTNYGVPTDAMIEAVRTTAALEGLLFDPVYSGKALAGLFDRARSGKFDSERAVVFLHTGGVPGLFAYRQHFDGKAFLAGGGVDA